MRIQNCVGFVLLMSACGVTARSVVDPAAADGPLGCWEFSKAIFRGLPLDTERYQDPPFRIVELTTAQIGRYATVRVLGVPGRRVRPDRSAYRLDGWKPIPLDSIEVFWAHPPNATEVRLQVRGDSATGESFYYGDILAPGQSPDDLRRSTGPISAVRVRCPDTPAR